MAIMHSTPPPFIASAVHNKVYIKLDQKAYILKKKSLYRVMDVTDFVATEYQKQRNCKPTQVDPGILIYLENGPLNNLKYYYHPPPLHLGYFPPVNIQILFL